jgi:hypothetical protein
MASKSLRVRYRPIRIGWCIEDGNLNEFRRAARLTHTLAGGKFNPIILVGSDAAGALVKHFRVDLLFPIETNDAKPDEPIPPYLSKLMTASSISTLDLNWDRIPSHDSAGFYAGRLDNFVDLVNYWNMRAADMNVLFLDSNHLSRLEQLRDDHIQFIFRRAMSPHYGVIVHLSPATASVLD